MVIEKNKLDGQSIRATSVSLVKGYATDTSITKKSKILKKDKKIKKDKIRLNKIYIH